MEALASRLRRAFSLSRESHGPALALARMVEADAREQRLHSERVQALAIQGLVQIAAGHLDDASAIATRIAAAPDATAESPTAAVLIAAFHSQLAFFFGAYRDALAAAHRAVSTADVDGTPGLRLLARQATTIVLGNLQAPELGPLLEERLHLAREAGDTWDVAACHNDLASLALTRPAGGGDAHREIERAQVALETLTEPAPILAAVIAGTRAEILTRDGRFDEALQNALSARRMLEGARSPDRYLMGIVGIVLIQCLVASGRLDEAIAEGRATVAGLDRYLPLLRSAVLAELARGLREAGRVVEAFDALSASIELEREAVRQFSALQHDVYHAVAAHEATRREADRLRVERDRDWLTGLRNRHALAGLDLAARERIGIAFIDVDRFKDVNDTHGHAVGDRVLVRIAEVITAHSRSDDVVVRLGGDEFLVVMLGVEQPAVNECATRILDALADEDWGVISPDLAVSVSIGVNTGAATDPLGDLISGADDLMYAAKRGGRGRMVGEG